MDYYPQVFAKDLSNLFALVSWATDMQRRGSYSQRHPNLGKMRRCPHCGKRRREFGNRCCNTKPSTTRRVWSEEQGFYQMEVPERTTDVAISKSVIKRLLKKKHGQSKVFKIKEQTLIFQRNPLILEFAAKEMHVKVPEFAHIPPFSEKYWFWKQEQKDRKDRKRQRESRRVNADS